MAFDHVPKAITIKRNWCVYRSDGNRLKVPHAPAGYKMAWSIPANWITFEQARNAYITGLELPDGHKNRFDGIGFFISREKDAKLDIYGIDLDHCRNKETGEIDQWAKDVLAKLNSYSEISPSGEGIHIFVRGMLPEGTKNTNDRMKDKNRIEVFVDKHHITVTGNRLHDYPEGIEDRSSIIEEIYNEVIEVKRSLNNENKEKKIKTKRIIYDARAEAKKKYVAAAMESELSVLRGTSEGDRNNQLNRSAFALGQFVGAHFLGRREAERALERAARDCGMTGQDGIEATIKSGLDDGELNPREIPEDEPAPLPRITVTPAPQAAELKTVDDGDEKESAATTLVKLAIKNSYELWHTPESEPYITIPINNHREHFRISARSGKIRAWMGKLFNELQGKTAGVSAIADAINVLAGMALYDGPEYALYVRKAYVNGKIYVDIGDPSWRAVEISSDGWKIVNECPVKFKRSNNSLPLPLPEKGGEIEELRDLINAPTEENWVLLIAWLSQAFWCSGPYAHLYLRGTQGTAKSYMMATIKAIADPSLAIKRRMPKGERDTAIALASESIPCFDNMSGVDDEIADLLCVASTGGVSTKRALFTDDDEAIVKIKCPIIANGIEDLGQRGDLLDRTIVLDLEPITEEDRLTEKEIQIEIEKKKAKLFGCLLDMTVRGLENIDSTELSSPPRMADFAQWACACLGDASKRFISIYAKLRDEVKTDLVGTNPFPAAVLRLAIKLNGKWTGSAAELLSTLNTQEGIYTVVPENWPVDAARLGSELRRFIPALEARGVKITFTRTGKSGRKIEIYYSVGVTAEDEDRHQKTDDGNGGDGSDSNLQEKKSNIIEGTVDKDTEVLNIKAVEKCRHCRHTDTDSDFGVTESDGNDSIRIACMMEYGRNGWVDPRKIAMKIKQPLPDVIAWLDANYEKKAEFSYTQRRSA